MDEGKKNYEIDFLVKAEEDKEIIVKALEKSQLSIIGAAGMSKIKLSYPIKKESFALFGYLYFSGNPENIADLTDELKNKTKILRFYVISRPIIEEKKDERIEETRPEQKQFPRGYQEKEVVAVPQPSSKTPRTEALSNEALEKRLEEILK